MLVARSFVLVPMSPFEIIMLICFGLAWPLSIYKSATSRQVGSRSLAFLIALLVGYIAGIEGDVEMLRTTEIDRMIADLR